MRSRSNSPAATRTDRRRPHRRPADGHHAGGPRGRRCPPHDPARWRDHRQRRRVQPAGPQRPGGGRRNRHDARQPARRPRSCTFPPTVRTGRPTCSAGSASPTAPWSPAGQSARTVSPSTAAIRRSSPSQLAWPSASPGPSSVRSGPMRSPRSPSATASSTPPTARTSPTPRSTEPSGGAALTLTGCTVVGKVHAALLTLVSDSIVWAALAAADTWTAGLVADRKQEGCVRFSFLPYGSVTPRRFECVEQALAGPQPLFCSLRYGDPGYLKLLAATDDVIRRGADDAGEMGAFHFVLAPQRETDLKTRLQEYIPGRPGVRADLPGLIRWTGERRDVRYQPVDLRPVERLLGVVMEQGRVQLDSDWNEWLAEISRRTRAGTLDLVGRAAYPPTTPFAFQITASVTGTDELADDRAAAACTLTACSRRTTAIPAAAAWDPALAELSGSPQPPPATDPAPVDFTAQPYCAGDHGTDRHRSVPGLPRRMDARGHLARGRRPRGPGGSGRHHRAAADGLAGQAHPGAGRQHLVVRHAGFRHPVPGRFGWPAHHRRRHQPAGRSVLPDRRHRLHGTGKPELPGGDPPGRVRQRHGEPDAAPPSSGPATTARSAPA